MLKKINRLETDKENLEIKPTYDYFTRECMILPLNERTIKKRRKLEEDNKRKREEEEKNQKAEKELQLKMMELTEIQKNIIQKKKLAREKKEKRIEKEFKELENIRGFFSKMLNNFYRSKTNKEIFLNFEIVNPPQMRLLFKVLEFNKSIRSLSINRSELKDHDIEDLIISLENNDYLEKIELNENLLSPKTIANLSTVIHKNQTLKYLSLEGNNITNNDEDLFHFSDFLGNMRYNTSLTYLNLAKTKLNNECLDIILDLLKYNKTLIMVDISFNNDLDYKKVRKIQDLLRSNKKLYEEERQREWGERQNLLKEDLKMREINNEKEILENILKDTKEKAVELQMNREILIKEDQETQEEEDRRLAKRIEKAALFRATRKKKKKKKKKE